MARGSKPDSPKPVVGVTGNARWFSPSWWCIWLTLSCQGAQAQRISVRHSVDLERLDALVVSGGDDIHPSLYQEESSHNVDYDFERDRLEQIHIRYALAQGLPLLGICRGHQLINVTCGGSLYADIALTRKNTSNRRVLFALKHATLKPTGVLARWFGRSEIRINSLHHQAIKRVADGFEAIAWDQDGFIQGIENTQGKPIFGVQWHPEYLFYKTSHRRIFRQLVLLAAQRRFAASRN